MKLFDKYDVMTFSLLLSVLFCVSCIKEEREECPCRLIVDLANVDSASVSSVDIVLADDEGFVYMGERMADSYLADEIILVPRDELYLNVSYGADDMMSAAGLRIPDGEACPPVYLYSALIDASESEFVRKEVSMRKCHCVMKIYLEGDEFPFEMSIKGGVCGYDALGFPLSGAFNCLPEWIEGSVYSVTLPRQKDASLLLEINDGTDVLKTFALGEYIKACGYDWTDADLKDLTVGIDYARTQIIISVQGWDEVYEFDIVI